WEFWFVRDYLAEGRRWLERLLGIDATGGRPPDAGSSLPTRPGRPGTGLGWHPRVAARNGLGILELGQRGLHGARPRFEEARVRAGAVDDPLGSASALVGLGNVARSQGDYEAAAALHEASLGLHRSAGDSMGMWRSLANLAETHSSL